VGTTSVEKSEILAQMLDEEGIAYEVGGREGGLVGKQCGWASSAGG